VRILALDTATENCSAALFINGSCLERERLLGRGAAEVILPMVEALLSEAQVGLRDLDALAFGRGPGGFTGVRLAASVTQGLAFGADLGVVGVSDLRALAQRAMSEDPHCQRVLACTDARMHEVYCGAFERSAAGVALAAAEERVVAPQRVSLPQAWSLGPRPVGVGSGFAAYPELAATLAGQLADIRNNLWPRAREIAQLAAAEVAAGRLDPPERALPVYLRDDVTQPARPQPRGSSI
jgi:tRNA threonylcarbamoyladenosine biosynthesis protein TsaB